MAEKQIPPLRFAAVGMTPLQVQAELLRMFGGEAGCPAAPGQNNRVWRAVFYPEDLWRFERNAGSSTAPLRGFARNDTCEGAECVEAIEI